MKSVSQTRRVILVPDRVHLAAKVQAASEGITLSQFADEALEAELRRRRERELRTVSQAAPVPVQSRG